MIKKRTDLSFLPERIEINRPEAIVSEIEAVHYSGEMTPQMAIDALLENYYVLIVDYYSSGLTILNKLKKYLKNEYSDESFLGQRDYRDAYHELSQRLIIKISYNKLEVKKAPEIGWFKKLYPELDEYALPFSHVQGLNSSWQWYVKGIDIPKLDMKIHPFYGTYFPTRFEHLTLFDNWLKHYRGSKRSAIDVGIGCGVLSFHLLKHGFEKIYGTDNNPNAVLGLNEELIKNKIEDKIEVKYGNLFSGLDLKTELIVFNPPWIPASQDIGGLDKSIYYDDVLFPSFFKKAKKYLEPNGRIILLFSNLARIANVSDTHPIESELTTRGRFQKELFIQKKVRSASKKTKRIQNWRSEEMVELWVLKRIN